MASQTNAQPALFETAERHFIEVEKNLISLGFFTPSSSRTITAERKVTSMVRYLDGKRIETTATILPSAYLGLPVTADQDKYFALIQIVQNLRRRTGQIPNPVGFTSAELLRILDKKKNGKNYEEVSEWMKRMTATTINATVYLAGRKAWVADTFHVFDRTVNKGMDLGNGKIADMNYIWLSSWQLENITTHYQLPIDFEAYKHIRNHIAKSLVPLLQMWLYSSIGNGKFEKAYTDLCQLLNIRPYTHLSKIKSVLGPSLDELTAIGYISDWAIERRATGLDFKLSITHGPKFFEDREWRQGRRRAAPVAGTDLLGELVNRGIIEDVARQLIAHAPAGQPILRQLEWGDVLTAEDPAKFRNPAGFYVYLIRNKVLPPPTFTPARQRSKLSITDESGSPASAARRLQDENEYVDYCNRQVDEALRLRFDAPGLQAELDRLKMEIRRQLPGSANWLPVRMEEIARQRLRAAIAAELPLLSPQEFLERREKQLDLFDS